MGNFDIEIIRKNKELNQKTMRFCDIEIYPEEQKPDDMDGLTIWNIDGMAFGCDASGGEYILLKDATIGFYSSEGDCGRIAENINELFELLLNIPNWMDYLYMDLYKNDEMIEKYMIKMGNDIDKNIQKELSEQLSIKLYENRTDLLKRFYKTANREPKYIYTYTEENGSKINSDGSLINRPLYDHVKERIGL